MTVQPLTDAVLLVGGHDFAPQMNEIEVLHSAVELNAGVFGNDAENVKGGLLQSSITMRGFNDSNGTTGPDDLWYPALGSNEVVTAVPSLAVAGDIGYSLDSARLSHNQNMSHGQLWTIEGRSGARSRLMRTTILQNGTETVTGSTTAIQVGAVSSTEKLYAVLHVIAASGTTPTLDVDVRSDDNSGMSSPAVRHSFTQVTSIVGAQFAIPVAGPITDDWWDILFTIGGTSPSYTLLAGISILPNR